MANLQKRSAAHATPVSHSRLSRLLPGYLPTWRGLIEHPTAVTTIGALFAAKNSVTSIAPWWNRKAIQFLEKNLHSGDRVFEWGSGGSTVWLIEQGARVTSVEDNTTWVEKVRSSCPQADIRSIPGAATGAIKSDWGGSIDDSRPFYDDYVAAIDEFPDDSFDVVIVDGQCRSECFYRAIPKVKPGGMLILDDSDFRAFAPLKQSLPGWVRVSLAGFKPTRDLRETTFFRRPN
jgi:hypothetical protein